MKNKVLILLAATLVGIATLLLRSNLTNDLTIDEVALEAKLESRVSEVTPTQLPTKNSNYHAVEIDSIDFKLASDLATEPTLSTSVENEIQLAVASLSNLNSPEESFKAQQTLKGLKPEHGDEIESALLSELFSGQLDARVGMEAIEIIGIESTDQKNALLDWVVQLTNDTDKLALVGVFEEISFDAYQQMQVVGIIKYWQQSSDEELRGSIAAIAVDIEDIDESVVATALQDESSQVRFAVLSSLQASGKDWPNLAPLIRALSEDELQPSEIRRISTQLL